MTESGPRDPEGGPGPGTGPPGGGGSPLDPRAAADRAARWARAGFFLFPPVAAAVVIAGLPPVHGIALAVLAVLLPCLAVAQLPLVEAQRAAGEPLERVPAYAGSAVTVLVLGGGATALGLLHPGAAALGLTLPPPGALLAWSAGLVVVALALMLLFHALGRRLGIAEAELLRDLLPESPAERRLFVVLSLCAGLGEEVAFRGYVQALLAEMAGGPWAGAALAAVPFGLVHAYQGAWGMLRTGLLGLLLGASVVLTGSLWPAVLAHAAVDVIGGLWLGRRLLGGS